MRKIQIRLLLGSQAVAGLLCVAVAAGAKLLTGGQEETVEELQAETHVEPTAESEQPEEEPADSGPVTVEVRQEGDIRVLIMTADYAALLHESLTVTSDTAYRLRYGQNMASEELHTAGETVTLEPDSAYFENGSILIEPLEDTGHILLPDVTRSEETGGYRGFLEVSVQDGGLAVVNELPLEEYLYCVVPSEMPASYGGEALKAQAVCARTYAAWYLTDAAYPEYGAHVNDSTAFQVYSNIREQETTNAAVDATCGKVLTTEEGELIRTYYYSTSCGLGSAAYRSEELRDEETFADFITSADADALEAQEPWFRWTYTVEKLDAETVFERLSARYEEKPDQVLTRGKKIYYSRRPKAFEQITSMEITERDAYGAAAELVLKTDSGTYKILTENAIRTILCDGETQVVRQDGSRVSMPNLVPSGFFILTVDKEGENVVGYKLTGGGFGHGTGMSQNAAKAMAALGYSCEEILAYFYQDCFITELQL